jgi:hypothetical protein
MIPGPVALQRLFTKRERARYPGKSDRRMAQGAVFPDICPSFTFDRGNRVFTIGSCFARNIEEHLTGFEVPTLRFVAPEAEWIGRRNGLLNEYNPGTMAQRIERAFTGAASPATTIVESDKGGMVDLLLSAARVVSAVRAVERRREIDKVYAQLPESHVVIVTLGLVEAWVDTRERCYLNRMPPIHLIQKDPDRYGVEVFDVDTAYALLDKAFETLLNNGNKVVLTVSPVPLNATFTGQDVVVANSFSKAVLRVCAERLAKKFSNIDYFPSYEIVVLAGLAAFLDDNIHVVDPVVGEIVQYMLSRYQSAPLNG